MSRIDEKADVLTLINTFTVEPGDQSALMELLAAATEEVIKNQPGFVSANIHGSLDGGRVVNYAQWVSKSDFDAMQRNPECLRHMKAAARLATNIEPVLYEVKSVHDQFEH